MNNNAQVLQLACRTYNNYNKRRNISVFVCIAPWWRKEHETPPAPPAPCYLRHSQIFDKIQKTFWKMFHRILNTPLDDTSRLDRSSNSMLLWKPSVFIVLLIIRNQCKAKTITCTVFETFINKKSRYKTQMVSWWVLCVGDARNIHESFY